MRIAIIVGPQTNDAQAWRQTLTGALALAQIETTFLGFEAAMRPSGVDAILPLMAWGYPVHLTQWRALLDAWDQNRIRTINATQVLRWNTDKTYLRGLEARGAPIVQTRFVDRITPDHVEAARAAFGADCVVVKPTISSGAFRTLKVQPGDALNGAPEGAAMIQPYLEAVTGEGELSLFYFGGAFSHCVTKVAKPGDFRTQPMWGAEVKAIAPPPEALTAAARVLAATPFALTYARIDLVRDKHGAFRLMELEAIEPDLFLAYAQDAGAMFARAVAAALTS